MSAIRLLICDVDGTLVTSEKELTPAAIDAAKKLRAAGIELVLTSGRPPRGMKMLTDPLGLESPLACFNGGAFIRPISRPSRCERSSRTRPRGFSISWPRRGRISGFIPSASGCSVTSTSLTSLGNNGP